MVQQKEIISLKDKCKQLEKVNCELELKVDKLEGQSGRSTLIFYNVREAKNESWDESEAAVVDIVQNAMGLKNFTENSIKRAHRLGKRRGEMDRPIIVKFSHYKWKRDILNNTRKLEGSKVGVSEDYT